MATRAAPGTTVRRILALALVLTCTVQAVEAFALIVPDDCVASPGAPPGDDCPDGCTHCGCCSRRPPVLTRDARLWAPVPFRAAEASEYRRPSGSDPPCDIFHVPRPR